MPPIRGFWRASGGKSQKSVTPAICSAAPRANAISVRLGARDTTRRGPSGTVTRRPIMSRVSPGQATVPVLRTRLKKNVVSSRRIMPEPTSGMAGAPTPRPP